MKIIESKLAYFKTNIPMIVSTGTGGIFCVICDYFANEHNSFILPMIQKMSSHLSIPPLIGFILLLLLLPLLSILLCFVIEPAKKLTAFYLGASILALIFNFTPVTDFAQLKSTQNSAKVTIQISEPHNKSLPYILVTVKDRNTNNIIGQSKYKTGEFSFYLDHGKYNMYIEVPGYKIIVYNIEVINDNDINLTFNLQSSIIPLQFQRLFINY